MTQINNYLKGNFPVMKDLVVTTVETEFQHLLLAKTLVNFSYVENSKGKDRIVLLLNFDIAKSKRFLYENHPDLKPVNKEVVKADPLHFVLEYGYTLEDIPELKKNSDNIEKQIGDIFNKVLEFYDKNVKHTKYPLVLYVHGLDVLSCYLKEEAITRFLLKLTEELENLRLLYFLTCTSTYGEKLQKAINAITNCKVVLRDSAETKELLEAVVTMIISKKGGYSSHEHFRVFIKRTNYNAVEFQKFKTDTEAPKKIERQDLNKMFGTSFNIETSDKQKAIKDQTTLPFMKMQDQNIVWKDHIKAKQLDEEPENSDEEIIDPEQDEDEDLDV